MAVPRTAATLIRVSTNTVTMVLRGSKVRPESVQGALEKIEHAHEALDAAAIKLGEAQRAMNEQLSHLPRQPSNAPGAPTTEDLLREIRALHERVRTLEEEQREAQMGLIKSQEGLARSSKQFACGGLAGALARTCVAPIDRVKILMQTQFLRSGGGADKYTGIRQAWSTIIREEGVKNLWRGNGTNCVRVIPYSATQFASYDFYKGFFVGGLGDELTIPQRLVSGACAGMTATTVTHPLDVIRLRLVVQPELKGVRHTLGSILAENGVRSLYKGYVPTILSLGPFIALNFAAFDTFKSWAQPDQHESKVVRSGVILGLGAAAGLFAQTCCYPLDTVRRRMQMAGTTYSNTVDAFHTIVRQEGIRGMYKGQIANAIKVMPNNGVRFLAFDTLTRMFGVERRGNGRGKPTARRSSGGAPAAAQRRSANNVLRVVPAAGRRRGSSSDGEVGGGDGAQR